MPQMQLDQALSPLTQVSGTVCIVGAGVAGLIAATRLARDKQRRVIVVESGGVHLDPSDDSLNEIDHASRNYDGALRSRGRALGGTSLLWAGKMIPLSREDTLCRPYLDLQGWPFDVRELDHYQAEIESLMGVDRKPYEGEIIEELDPGGLLPREDGDFKCRWPKRPSDANHNLAHVFRNQIEELDNLEIWLGATVSVFHFAEDRETIRSVTAVSRGGKALQVTADRFLIAAGTLESTRLLLLADRQSNHAITRDCDVLGRYFNDHLGLEVATLRPRNRTIVNQTFSDRSPLDSWRHLHFELRSEIQKENGVSSAYFDIGASLPDSSALTKAKQAVQGFKQKRLAWSMRDAGEFLRDSPSLFQTWQWQSMRKQKYWPANASLSLKVWVEQCPRANNRLSLSDDDDPLGVPRLRLDWEKTAAEEKVFRFMVEKIDRLWSESFAPVCDLEWNLEVLNPANRMVDAASDLAHPAGSTRMGNNPSDSVVDAHLRVHRLSNLSVASASVFPSSGSANPTLDHHAPGHARRGCSRERPAIARDKPTLQDVG